MNSDAVHGTKMPCPTFYRQIREKRELRIIIICDDVYLLSFIFSFTRSVLLRQPLIIPHFPHFLSKFLPGYTHGIMRPNTVHN